MLCVLSDALTLLEAQSRSGDKLLGIRVNLSPKRDCGSKRVNTYGMEL